MNASAPANAPASVGAADLRDGVHNGGAASAGSGLHRPAPWPASVAFAEEIGAASRGPICVVGGRTQWDVGGAADLAARAVRAPVGVRSVEAAELIARCGAGTTWAELDAALASVSMMCPIDPISPNATVGGVFAVGHSGHRRLRYGHVRDLLLEARVVDASGRLLTAGAPVVKNVTGYDLCRLLVGSLGVLGSIAEVVVRCRPRPAVSEWRTAHSADPFAVRSLLTGPASILWNGAQVWVLLEGSATEVRVARSALGSGWTEAEAPNLAGVPVRRSLRPSALRGLPALSLDTPWLAEIGVGTVHVEANDPAFLPITLADPRVAALNEAVRVAFDPTGRCNPGRRPW
jgi:hypothetical protein